MTWTSYTCFYSLAHCLSDESQNCDRENRKEGKKMKKRIEKGQ